METSKILLVVAFCSLSLFNPANALCVPRNTSIEYDYTMPMPTYTILDVNQLHKSTPSPAASPIPVPTPTESAVPTPPTPTESAAPTPSKSAVPTPSESAKDKVNDIAQGIAGIFQAVTSKTLAIHTELKDICSKTDYVDLCLTSLSPLYSGKTDPATILQSAIKVTDEATKWAMAEAEKMANAPGTDKFTVSRLNDCKESYEDALENFQTAIEAIPSMDIGTINSYLSAVVTDFMTCDEGFAEFHKEPLMASYNEKLSQMGSNCLAIASLVK
ncbi:hypothetical protein ACFE04_011837 [Oxalis oulophora]